MFVYSRKILVGSFNEFIYTGTVPIILLNFSGKRLAHLAHFQNTHITGNTSPFTTTHQSKQVR